MTGYSGSPRIVKGGIVIIDPATTAVQRIISLQYNPDSLQRTLQVQGTGNAGARSEALRLRAPASETLKLDAELDATDQLELSDRNPTAVDVGIHPQLAALEMLVQPLARELSALDALASAGTIEVLPLEAPLSLFVWNKQRVLPVRITDFSVTEEAFDPNLNPIRAKVSLSMRVLNVDDVGFRHRAGQLFMGHLRQKEQLATRAPRGQLSDFGLRRIP
jgi:hypothetical protein